MRAQFRQGLFEDRRQSHEFSGKGDFALGFERRSVDFKRRVGGNADLAENRVHTRGGVEQVGGCIAFKCKKFVPREHVVARSVLYQVGIAQGGNAHGVCNFVGFVLRNVGVLFLYNRLCSCDGFVEQHTQADWLAALGFDCLAVFAENRSEPDVPQVGKFIALCVEPFFCGEEKLLEVVLLVCFVLIC